LNYYQNWHAESAEQNFKNELKQFKNVPNLNYLQIGAYTGDCSLWLFKNVLTHPSSRLTDIDCWDLIRPKDYLTQLENDWTDVEATYDKKIFLYKDRINKNKALSQDWLLANRTEQYDFIYIDGDHTPKAVMTDGILAWNLLKVGGILAFDDYLWQHPFGELFNPKPAIDLFQNMYRNETEIIVSNWQVWLKKTKE
jgi:predicted O-methyltransferase YrrM